MGREGSVWRNWRSDNEVQSPGKIRHLLAPMLFGVVVGENRKGRCCRDSSSSLIRQSCIVPLSPA